jgi:hypothetical protein
MHLVLVPSDGNAVSGRSFFFASPAGTGAVYNVQTGPPNRPAAGPLRFVSLASMPTRQVPRAVIPSPLSTPFSPSRKRMLVLCPIGQCILNAATGARQAAFPFIGYDGEPEYPAQSAGWYDDQHMLEWIGVGPGRYELVTVSLSGVATSIIAVDRSLDIPQMFVMRGVNAGAWTSMIRFSVTAGASCASMRGRDPVRRGRA